jgi:hypothetical protein
MSHDVAPVIDKDATGHNILGVCSIAPHVARDNSIHAQQCRMAAHGQVGSEAIPWQPIFLNRCNCATKCCLKIV